MHKLKVIFSVIIIGAIVASCGNFSDITVGEISDFNVKGFKDNALEIEVKLPIDNPTMYRITITEFDSKVYMNNQYLGKVSSAEPVILVAKSDKNYNLVLQVRMANFFGSALTMMNLKNGQKIKIRVEGTINARSLLLHKKIAINEERQVVI